METPAAANQARRVELFQLALLLLLDAVFYWLVIPTGIVDPPGYGLEQGLPPSFSARLVAVLAAALIMVRIIWLWTHGDKALALTGPMEASDPGNFEVVISRRCLVGIGLALLFATVLAPYLGFLLGGALLLPALLITMGERRPLALLLHPCIVLFMVWLLFEKLLAIHLPLGRLFSQ